MGSTVTYMVEMYAFIASSLLISFVYKFGASTII